jgi:hypothetical protein
MVGLAYLASPTQPQPQNTCIGVDVTENAQKADLEIYPSDLRLLLADGTIQSERNMANIILNPASSIHQFQLDYVGDSTYSGVTPVYYGRMTEIETGANWIALFFLDRNVIFYYACVR